MPRVKLNPITDSIGEAESLPKIIMGDSILKILVIVLLILVILMGYFVYKVFNKFTKTSEEVTLVKDLFKKQVEMVTNNQPPEPDIVADVSIDAPEHTTTETKNVPTDKSLETVDEHKSLEEIDEV